MAGLTVADLDVLTLDEAKEALGIDPDDTEDDELLARKITAVSQALDGLCGPVVQRTVTEVHAGGRPHVWVDQPPVKSFTSVTEYDATVPQVLTAETYASQPAAAYLPDRFAGTTSTYNGKIRRRAGGVASTFPVGPEAVRVVYVAGRFESTATVDPIFKDVAGVMLKNSWRPHESGVQSLGEFDVPAQNFPRFGVPNYVRDLLPEAEWAGGPNVA